MLQLRHILLCGCCLVLLSASAQGIEIPTIELQAPDQQQLQTQDDQRLNSRFSAPLITSIALADFSEPGPDPSGQLQRLLNIQSAGALGLGFFLEDVYLPAGASIEIFGAGTTAIGPIQAEDIPSSGRLFAGFVKGARATVQIRYAPQGPMPQLRIFRVDYAYQADRWEETGLGRSNNTFGFDSSGECHDNPSCLLDSDWDATRQSVCRIFMVLEEGVGYCTGTLINSTAQQPHPYVLTAFHCQLGFTPIYELWRFDFNYATGGCPNPSSEPSFQTFQGAELLARRQESDFLLLEVTDNDIFDADLWLSGWDRSPNPISGGATMIHHPRGDIQKVGFTNRRVEIFSSFINWEDIYSTPPNHHYEMFYDEGAHQIGSSGAALFDSQRRIRGQLHGGRRDCVANPLAYCGRLSISWNAGADEGSQLAPWLDPENTGLAFVDGRALQTVPAPRTAVITRRDGTPLPNVSVQWTAGGQSGMIQSNADGQVTFPAWPEGLAVIFQLSKMDAAAGGLSVSDILLVQRHILNRQLITDELQLMSADVNGSGNLSVSDILSIQNIILGKRSDFGNRPVWQFALEPGSHTVLNAETDMFSNVSVLLGADTELQFTAVKTGDVNDSF